MEQRRLRLGDILDDYCPRERRVTNHAVVAMIEEDVKQTRCTTCDAEHAYKGGREPRRRKKAETGALYREVLAGMPDGEYGDAVSADVASDAGNELEINSPMPNQDDVSGHAEPEEVEPLRAVEEGPVHRPLIRATLPRVEGQKEVRQVPDFTIRHSSGNGRGGAFRGSQQRAGGAGQAPRQGGRRFSGGGTPARGPSPAPGSRTAGSGAGFRGANGQHRHGGKKRSR
jgi:hypothetical protein